MFTTLADFQVVPYAIPSQLGDGAAETVTPFIAIAERNNLTLLLGFFFYESFIAALPSGYSAETDYAIDEEVLVDGIIYKSLQTPNLGESITDVAFWEPQPANRWTKLLNGENYTNSQGRKNKWVGMKELCKPVVFAEVIEKFNDYMSSMGVVVAAVENAKYVDAGIRMADGLNEFARIACGDLTCITEVNSLYGYLYSVRATFDDVAIDAGYTDFEDYLNYEFAHPGNTNIFNL